jgi:hypothetical protein
MTWTKIEHQWTDTIMMNEQLNMRQTHVLSNGDERSERMVEVNGMHDMGLIEWSLEMKWNEMVEGYGTGDHY